MPYLSIFTTMKQLEEGALARGHRNGTHYRDGIHPFWAR